IKKAVSIAESFEVSKQFWAYLVQKGVLSKPEDFIKHIPHLSFVWGKKNVDFLKTRHTNLTSCNLFKDMEYSEDTKTLKEWIPLVMEGRDVKEKVAA
ncbi:malate:quinone oxidoreductase, partial [Streptomyces sp. P17]|uniref:malate:quinone oxidoreductase n=1 Tax=Streptomyces sp. P17 TaxID=3074716 RepID=UPI0028F453AC